LQGYEEALRESDVPVDKALVLEGDYRLESGHKLAAQLLKNRNHASAIFVCNGVMTVGVLNAFEEAGVECPRDISLATFDDLTLDHSSHSHLTAVVQPSYEMGARAATLLIDRIEGRLTGDPIVLRVVPTLMIRQSTAHHHVIAMEPHYAPKRRARS
jgi:DNA-binding LacI/PurR family transcriptional regulator